MGLLDDAIREHLELKRRHGADPQEVARQEDEALGAIGEPVVSSLLEAPLKRLGEPWHTGIALTVTAILAFTILSYFHVVLG